LKYDWQFEKYLNKKVEVKLYKKTEEIKDFVGILLAFNEKELTFKIDNDKNKKSKKDSKDCKIGEVVTLDRQVVATVLPFIEF